MTVELWYGIVESRDDPLYLGRVRARISGVHTEDKTVLPTADLPWATPIQSYTSAAVSGIGSSATGPVEGTMVVCVFADESKQIPLIFGTIAGIPSYDVSDSPPIIPRSDTGVSSSQYEVNPVQISQSNQGFKDPNNKYPLSGHKDEPDTPRLSSVLKLDDTIISVKEATIEKSIPIANGSSKWKQSPVPYNARYPYNHVYQTESGHVMEFDDTDGAERINIHHRSGTFNEIDNEGNQVEKTVGIRTIIVEKDELIYVKGSGHVNIVGDLSVRVGGQCQIEILGNANLKVHGDLNQEVTGDYNLLVGKAINIKSGLAASITSGTMINLLGGSLIAADASQIHLNSGMATSALANPIAPYNPMVKIPAPVTRYESELVRLEDEATPPELMAKAEAASNNEAPVTGATYSAGDTVTLPDGTTEEIPATPTETAAAPVSGACGFAEITYSTQLSTNYTIKDLCKDGAFAFNGQNGVTAETIACNMKQLCLNVIEPLRAKYAAQGFKINSCFRPRRNGKSQHEFGMAVDIGFSKIRGKPNDRIEYLKIAKEIAGLVPFDQLIFEMRSNGSVWIHISFNMNNLRKVSFTMNNDRKISNDLVLVA